MNLEDDQGRINLARILVHVEGQTEEAFVNESLRPHLLQFGHYPEAKHIGNSRQRGGICSWHDAKRDIRNHLLQDSSIYATTMVDYYGLPEDGHKAWPGRKVASGLAYQNRGPYVEEAVLTGILEMFDEEFSRNRFIPYVMMHEFEGLLFSDCEKFAESLYQPGLASKFQGILNQVSSPEEINDGYDTCPSRRIENHFPQYEKPLHGNLAALEIGIAKIRQECPQFDNWIRRLESIPK